MTSDLRSSFLQPNPLAIGNSLRQHAGITVHAVRYSEEPELVREAARRRSTAFDHGETWSYGLDEVDRRAWHLIAFDQGSSEPAGALRLNLGEELLAYQGLAAFYLSTGWDLGGADLPFWRSTIEYGRFWAARGHLRTRSIALALLTSLAEFVAGHHSYTSVCGTVSLVDYPAESRRLIVSYLHQYHLPWPYKLTPLRPAVSAEPHSAARSHELHGTQELRRLGRQLRAISSAHLLPHLLQFYLTRDAELLGPVALDATGRKLLIPLFLRATVVRSVGARLRRSDGETDDVQPSAPESTWGGERHAGG